VLEHTVTEMDRMAGNEHTRSGRGQPRAVGERAAGPALAGSVEWRLAR